MCPDVQTLSRSSTWTGVNRPSTSRGSIALDVWTDTTIWTPGDDRDEGTDRATETSTETTNRNDQILDTERGRVPTLTPTTAPNWYWQPAPVEKLQA